MRILRNREDQSGIGHSALLDGAYRGEAEFGLIPASVEVLRIPLSTGLSMEVFRALPDEGALPHQAAPPLIFVRGSFHGGWCFASHWLPWFAARGHASYSVSLRGTT